MPAHTILLRAHALASLLVIGPWAYPQDIPKEVGSVWSAQRSKGEHGTFLQVAGASATHVYVIVERRKERWLQAFSADLVFIVEARMVIEAGGEEVSCEEVLFLADRAVLLGARWDGRQNTSILHAQGLSLIDLKTLGPAGTLGEIGGGSKAWPGYFVASVTNQGHAFTIESCDSEKAKGLYVCTKWYISPDLAIEMTVKGRSPSRVWKPSGQFSEWLALPDGISRLTETPFPGTKDVTMEWDDRISGSVRSTVFPLQGHRGVRAWLDTLGARGPILCFGLYTDSKRGFRGTFRSEVDRADGKVDVAVFTPFSAEFMAACLGSRAKWPPMYVSETKGELEYFEPHEPFVAADGHVLIVVEYSYMGSSANDPAGQLTERGPLVLVRLGPTGDIVWSKIVLKEQFSRNQYGSDMHSSFAALHVDDASYFVFNDHPKNRGRTGGELPERTNTKKDPCELVVVKVDAAGVEQRWALTASESPFRLEPAQCRAFDDDRLILYSSDDDSYQLGAISLD